MAAKSWGIHPEKVLEGDAYWFNRLIKENNIRAELEVPLL